MRRVDGAEATQVPYAGTLPSMTALLAGDIDVVLGRPRPCCRMSGAGARAVAMMSVRRTPVLPALRRTAEAGPETIVDTTWIALLFPAGPPREVLERVNADVPRAMQRPAVPERLAATGLDPIGGDLASTRAFVAGEVARWRDAVCWVKVRID